jgi:hypothetical protein
MYIVKSFKLDTLKVRAKEIPLSATLVWAPVKVFPKKKTCKQNSEPAPHTAS